MLMIGKCVLCGSGLKLIFRNIFDARFGIKGKYKIGRCGACGIEQISSIPSHKDLKDLYETHYNFGGEKGTIYTRFRARFFSSVFYRFWLAIDGDISFYGLKGSGWLLDVGCNEGRGLSIYQRNGFDVEGLELNEQAAAEARKCGHTVFTNPLENFQLEQPYDVVVLSNVLEHSLDPKNMLFHVHRILKPGGKVWISLPNANSWLRYIFGGYWINWHVPFHIVHFSPEALKRLLQDEGFNVDHVAHKTPALWVAHSIISFLFSKPGYMNRYLRSPLLVGSLMLFIRFVLFPLLWLGNLTGHGDCLVVEAKKI